MHRHHLHATCVALTLLAFCSSSNAANIVETLDDVSTWVGSGSNRSGLVIDWGDDRAPVAWGYRWEGPTTAEDLVRAVDVSDVRLVGSFSEIEGFGTFVDSFGYDRDDDGFSTADVDDSFGQGTFFDFWEFFTAHASPYDGSSAWTSSDVGISSSTLTDGSWVGFRFDADFPGPGPGPVPASVPEPSSSLLLLYGTFLGAGFVGRIRRASRTK